MACFLGKSWASPDPALAPVAFPPGAPGCLRCLLVQSSSSRLPDLRCPRPIGQAAYATHTRSFLRYSLSRKVGMRLFDGFSMQRVSRPIDPARPPSMISMRATFINSLPPSNPDGVVIPDASSSRGRIVQVGRRSSILLSTSSGVWDR
jgi:hypothetical protein